ncbi:MAG TPA: RNA polymerase sigma-70 factor [Bacteroidales bacterium]|nr:RNA polymerase sigma-70 factor [Bacteroidales bacterium]
MKNDDSHIWNQLKIGDKKAFEYIFKNYYLQLCLFSKQYTGNIDDSREVVQDLFIWLWEKRGNLDHLQSVKTYVHSSLRFNSIRKRSMDKFRFIDTTDISEEKFVSGFHDELEYTELQSVVFKVINRLPDRCREIFELSRYEKHTYKEIAQKLGISVKTVEGQISKALRNIQSGIEKYLIVITGVLLVCKFIF